MRVAVILGLLLGLACSEANDQEIAHQNATEQASSRAQEAPAQETSLNPARPEAAGNLVGGGSLAPAALPPGIEDRLQDIEELAAGRDVGRGAISERDRERLSPFENMDESRQAQIMARALQHATTQGAEVGGCDRIKSAIAQASREAGTEPPSEEEMDALCERMGGMSQCFRPPEQMPDDRTRQICRRLGQGTYLSEGIAEGAPPSGTMVIQRN